MKKKSLFSSILALLLALLMVFGQQTELLSLQDLLPSAEAAETVTLTEGSTAASAQGTLIAKSKKKKKTSATATPVPTVTPAPTDTASAMEEDGTYTAPQDVADYLFTYGKLPSNFLTKKEAQALGWDSKYNYVGDVAPGMSIGGDYFGNYEKKLPTAKGRTYYECDVNYTGGRRGAERIIFSNDGLVYFTEDHYETFTEMQPSWEMNE